MESTRRTSGRFNVTQPDYGYVRPEKEGLKDKAFRLVGDLKEWAKKKWYEAKETLYSSKIGGFVSKRELASARKALKTHSTAVELFKTMKSKLEDVNELSIANKKALRIVTTQLEKATKNKKKAKESVRSSRENAIFVKNNKEHDTAVSKFEDSINRLKKTKVSRKDLNGMAKEMKGNITKKCTPGIFTRTEKAKQEMNDVKNLLLKSLDDSTTELEKFKETKKERDAKLDAKKTQDE